MYLLQNKLQSTKVLKLRKMLTHFSWSTVRNVILVGLAFINLFPLLYMISIAFRPSSQIVDPTVIWIPKDIVLDNIKNAISFMSYFKSLGNTLLIGIVSAIFSIFSCSIIGYGFARFNFKFKNLLFAIVIFTIIIPPQTLIIPQYIQNQYFDFFFIGKLVHLISGKSGTVNLLNTPWAFYLPAIFGYGIRSGLQIFIFRQFFRGMPNELEDAANIDGCGPVKTFIKVMMPNAGAALLTVLLFSVVWYWNDYYNAGLFLSTNMTVSVSLSKLRGAALYQLSSGDPYAIVSLLEAGSLLTIMPILLLYVVLQHYFTESIERTGIVG